VTSHSAVDCVVSSLVIPERADDQAIPVWIRSWRFVIPLPRGL